MKNKLRKNILVCGLSWSGSGTVIGLLNEYDNVIQIPGGPIEIAQTGYEKLGEFEYFRSPGSIGDMLAMKEGFFKPNYLLNNLKKQKLHIYFSFFKNIINCRKIKGFLSIIKNFRQVVKTNRLLQTLAFEMLNTKDKDIRLQLSREWLDRIVEISGGKGKKAVVFDQALHLKQHLDVWPELFKPFKIIFGYRDPRDILAEQKKYKALFRDHINANVACIYGDTLNDAITFNCDATFARMNEIDNLLSLFDKDEILNISFEDLVGKYSESKRIIENFIGLNEENHTSPKKYFDPNWSKKNIGVYKNSDIIFPKEKVDKMLKWYKKHSNNKKYNSK